jgi:hypothetical protein
MSVTSEPTYHCPECLEDVVYVQTKLTAGWGSYPRIKSADSISGLNYYGEPYQSDTSPGTDIKFPVEQDTIGEDWFCDKHLKSERKDRLASDREDLTKRIEQIVAQAFEGREGQIDGDLKGQLTRLCEGNHDDITFKVEVQTTLANAGVVIRQAQAAAIDESSEQSTAVSMDDRISFLTETRRFLRHQEQWLSDSQRIRVPLWVLNRS